MRARVRLVAGLLLSWCSLCAAAMGDDAELAAGRALYLQGRRSDGTPLAARRAGGFVLAGAEAACVNCHRRSAMGGTEGRSYIPPITQDTLLQAMPAGKGPSATGWGRPAYSAASLSRALHAGVDPAGRALDYLMPRYELDAQEISALMHYLGSLPKAQGRSVEDGLLHFATVVAPGLPEQDRRAMTDVLQACFAEHNAGPKAERGRHKLAPEMSVRQPRAWKLHVWELQGKEEEWEAQLASHAQQEPVFATVGGLGAGGWSPVHAFCERTQVPCVFPHVDVPVDSPSAFHPLYLSKGVLLDAALMAQHLSRGPAPRRVFQVLRESDSAALAAANALQRSLDPQVAQRMVPFTLTNVSQVLAESSAQDLVVLWLRPADLQGLGQGDPPAAPVLLSGTLAGQDAVPLPPAWLARTLMAYPFELPQQRSTRMQGLHAWLRSKGLARGNERIQADAWLACMAMRNAIRDAESHLGRDYMVEKLEANIERWPAIGLYPRLALGIGQRFASKTGYMVRFDAASGRLEAVEERSAP